MCRLLAYLGEDIPLVKLLLDPEHSLEKQAWMPQELREARLNADGFGFAWYNDNKQIACYRNTMPIWNDANLADLSRSLSRPLWLAYVRSATPGLGVSLENTQPFIYQQWAFTHNGYILDYRDELRYELLQHLTQPFLYLIKGNTDSEYIFALLMQLLEQYKPLEAMRRCMQIIEKTIKDKRALLNIMITDGEQVYACKHAINGLCPSLYYSNNNDEFGLTSQLLVSEKLNNHDSWQSIGDHQLIHIQATQTISLESL